jgi:hypothetical protein
VKYKICKFKDANNKEWYQIKVKWWIFWYNYETPDYGNYDCSFWELEGDRFDTEELAQKKVKELIRSDKAGQIQLLECVEV